MKTIGVFFGGMSPEHDVSIITGQLIVAGLKKLGYSVIPVYVTKKGKWVIDKKVGEMDFFKREERDELLSKMGIFAVELNAGAKKMILKSGGVIRKKYEIDLAFPAFHGLNGEDGTVQGLFELCGVPYVGCDVAVSAMGMDKVLTKLFYESNGIATTRFVYFHSKDWQAGKEKWLEKINDLTWPVFVKPARLGSSIGIAKVKDKKDLEFAIEVALHYDSKVLIEEGVENLMDVTCCVIGNDKPIVSELQESTFTDDFFSYEEKYLKEGGSQLGQAEKNIVIPARLDEKTTQKIKDLSVKIYSLAGCSGISRVDYLYDTQKKKIYANEMNTLPGTIYHHLWKKSGIEISELLEKLVEFAEDKYDQKRKLTSTFESEILSKMDSGNKLGQKLGLD